MLSIIDGGSLSRALDAPISDLLKTLLIKRRDQLGGDVAHHARIVVAQERDGPNAIDQALGFSILNNPIDGSRFGDPDFTPAWEWLADHGFCFEMVFIFDDSGFAHVVLIEKGPAMDPLLRTLCQTYASEHA